MRNDQSPLEFAEVRYGRQTIQRVAVNDLRWARSHVRALADRKGVDLTLEKDGVELYRARPSAKP